MCKGCGLRHKGKTQRDLLEEVAAALRIREKRMWALRRAADCSESHNGPPYPLSSDPDLEASSHGVTGEQQELQTLMLQAQGVPEGHRLPSGSPAAAAAALAGSGEAVS